MLFTPVAFSGIEGTLNFREITITVFFQSVFQRKVKQFFISIIFLSYVYF